MDSDAQAVFASHVSARRRMQKRCKAVVRYFSLVQIGPDRGYIALGKHAIFLLKEVDLQLTVLREIPFSNVARVVIDPDDKTLFSVEYTTDSVIAGTIPLPGLGSVEVLKTSARSEVIQELEVYWKADRLFQLRRVLEFPLVQEPVPRRSLPADVSLAQLPLPKPVDSWQRIQFCGFEFFVPSRLGPIRDPGSGAAAGAAGAGVPGGGASGDMQSEGAMRFRGSNDETLLIEVAAPKRVWELCRQSADELPVIAMRTARQAVFEECELVSHAEHRKKYNLRDDPASWAGHSCVLRTRERTVAVIAMRRKYIPPFGETYQDICITLFGPRQEVPKAAAAGARAASGSTAASAEPAGGQSVAGGTAVGAAATGGASAAMAASAAGAEAAAAALKPPVDCLEDAERVADTFTSTSDTLDFDSFVVSTKCNCLEWDEASLEWFEIHPLAPIRPHAKVREPAAGATKKAAELAERAGIPDVLPNILFPTDYSRYKTFWAAVDDLRNKPPPSLGLGKSSTPALWENWYRRVARYVAFCVDGGIQFNFSFATLVRAWRFDDSRAYEVKEDIERILEYCMYLRIGESYDPKPLREKVAELHQQSDLAAIDGSDSVRFVLNERACVRLLEFDFLREVLRSPGAAVPDELFVKFLKVILRHKGHTRSALLHAVCAQIAILSGENADMRALLARENIIQLLVQLLRIDDPVLVESCAKALTNMTSGNPSAKQVVIKEGALRLIAMHLSRLQTEPTCSLCRLMRHLISDNVDACERLMLEGGLPLLADLLKPELFNPRSNPRIVAAASAALWNAMYFRPNRGYLLETLPDFAGDVGRVLATLDCRFIRDPRGLDTRIALEKLAGVVMVLALDGTACERLVSLGAVEQLTACVEETFDANLIRNALGALAALATLRPELVCPRVLRQPEFRNQMTKIKQTENEKAIEFARQLSATHKDLSFIQAALQ